MTAHLFPLRGLMAEVQTLGVTFRLSGADVVIGGLDGLPGSLQEALEEHRQSGMLWAYLGGDEDDDPAVAFAEQLGVAVHLVSSRRLARTAVRQLIRDMRRHGGHLAIDCETAPMLGHGKPRPCVKLKKDGGLYAVQPTLKDKTALDPHQSRIELIQLFAGGRACFVFRGEARELIAGSNWIRRQNLVAHSAGFELSFLRPHTPRKSKIRRRPGRLDWTIQATALMIGVGFNGSNLKLEYAAKALLGLDMPKKLGTSDWAAATLSPGQIAYAASDAIVTWRLWSILSGQLHQSGRQAAYKLQVGAIPAVVSMEQRGIGFDLAEHARQVEEWSRDLAAARENYHAERGTTPPSTAAEIRVWLRSVLTADQLAAWPLTPKTLELSTEAEHLLRLVVDVPSAKPVIDILAKQKLISSFGPKLVEHINPVTGRLHCRFKIAATKAGRFSASDPNPQQFPSKKRAPGFRRCIIAAPGYVIICCDWSQVELRAAAWISGDRVLTDLYRRGGDLHRENAAAMLGISPDAVTDLQRDYAKPVSFGALYGIGAKSLAADAFANYKIDMSEAEATHALQTFFGRFRQLDRWLQDNADTCRAQGFVGIGVGRVVEAEWEKFGLSFPQCCNLPIQGICADAMLRAIPLAHARLAKARVRGGLIATIHDELIAEVVEADGERARVILQDAMIEAFITTFPGAPSNGVAVAKIGRTWAEAKD